MKNLNALDWISIILVVIGGLNWGLIGLFDLDIVTAVFGDMSVISRIIYVLVGLSAIYLAVISATLHKEEAMMSREKMAQA